MPNYGHSCLFLGIPLFVSRNLQQAEVQRFDAITGQPKLITSQVMKLEILDKEFQQFDTLPDDGEVYEDCPDKYLNSMERWHTERVSRRIYDWLKSHGVEDEDEVDPGKEDPSKLYYLRSPIYTNNLIDLALGRPLARGTGHSMHRINADIEKIKAEVQAAFVQTFADAADHMDTTPMLILETTP